MDRRKVESITASLAVILLLVLTFGGILFMGDQFFNWDLFSPRVEKVIGFILVSMLAIIISSVLVNIMINVGIISINSDIYLEKLIKKIHGKPEET